MATPGHPFETEALDEQRARQRRMLRMVDTHAVVETARATEFPAVRDDDRGLVEQTLRDLADKEATQVGADRLAGMGPAEIGSVMQGLFEALHRPPFERERFRPDVAELHRQYVQDQGSGPDVNDVIDPLVRMVAFLIWADKLAMDQYTDPRVKYAEENR